MRSKLPKHRLGNQMNDPQTSSTTKARVAVEAREWIVRLNSGDVETKYLEEFRSWRDRAPENALAFERERAFWKQLQHIEPKEDTTPDAQSSPIGRRHFLLGGLATAAAVAGIAPIVIEKFKADYVTAIGERAEFGLNDGSRVIMNTDSAISVSINEQQRNVILLRGEAEFYVQANHRNPLIVRALNGESTSAEGKFAIKLLDNTVTVTALDGKTTVSNSHDTIAVSLELQPSQQAIYRRSGHPYLNGEIDVKKVLAWQAGRIIFENAPLADALADLERYLPERILLAPGVKRSTRVSGTFTTDRALAAVNALVRIQGRTITRLPGVAILVT